MLALLCLLLLLPLLLLVATARESMQIFGAQQALEGSQQASAGWLTLLLLVGSALISHIYLVACLVERARSGELGGCDWLALHLGPSSGIEAALGPVETAAGVVAVSFIIIRILILSS